MWILQKLLSMEIFNKRKEREGGREGGRGEGERERGREGERSKM